MFEFVKFDDQRFGLTYWRGDMRISWNMVISRLAIESLKVGWGARAEPSYVDLCYHLGIPSVETTFYKPHPVFCEHTMRSIFFYDPRKPRPDESWAYRMAAPYTPVITPGGYTQLESYGIVVNLIKELDAEADAIFIPGNPPRIRIIYKNAIDEQKVVLHNNKKWFPHSAWGTGGYTEHGGFVLTSHTARNTQIELGIFQELSHLYFTIKLKAQGVVYETSSMMGYYAYYYAITPHQFILVRDLSRAKYIGDLAANADSLLISLPDSEEIHTYISGLGFKIGAKYYGAVIEGGYPGGSILDTLSHSGEDVGILFGSYGAPKKSPTGIENASPSWGLRSFWSYHNPCGVSFPTFRSPTYIHAKGNPMLSPAYVALPIDPTKKDSQTRIVGYLRNAMIVSKYFPVNTFIVRNNLPWMCIASQNKNVLGQTPASLFVLAATYYKRRED